MGQLPRNESVEEILVYADERWPPYTSVGAIQDRYKRNMPAHMEVIDLKVPGRIGSPLSPLRISQALTMARRGGRGVFFSAGYMPPLWSQVPVVVVVHDLTHRYTYGPAKRLYYDMILRRLFRKCAAIICVSDYTRRELVAWAGLDAERVHVVYNGRPERLAADGPRHEPGYPYIFYCGNHRAHKNLHRMVEAYCLSRLPSEGVRLLLTNGPNAELFRIAQRYGHEDKVVFAGFLSEEALYSYYRGARAVIYVSLMEGFGLPILEGFSADVPVLTSDLSSMPEIAADAALMVDPHSIDQIVHGMERIVADDALRNELIGRGRVRLQDFDWDRSARHVWEIVESVA